MFQKERGFVFRDFSYLISSFPKSINKYSAKGKKEATENAVNWLLHSQKMMKDQGFGSYHIINKWSSSYPETSGYIIPTLIEFGEKTNNQTIIEKAISAADWLIKIQKESGGWQGGRVEDDNPEIVFNTGQIIRGLLAVYNLNKEKKYLNSAIKAADWLCSVQSDEGFWKKNALMNRERVYDSYVDVPLILVYLLSSEKKYLVAARKNLDWIINKKQKPNGWFEDCDNTIKNNDRPILHTISYTIDGLLDSGIILDDNKLIEAAEKPAKVLLEKFQKDGFLNGRFNSKWEGSEYMLLTGCAQIAIVWMKLYKIGKGKEYLKAAKMMNSILVTIQKRSKNESLDTKGALSGSFPIWGRYEPFAFPNWATKYFIDSLMLENNFTLTEKDRHKILIKRFESAVAQYPNRSALEVSGKSFSYFELNTFSDNIANCIIENSEKECKMAAVLGAKSLETYAAVLGILKASKAYVPLNPRFPIARTINMIKKSGVDTIILSHESLGYLKEILLKSDFSLKIILPNVEDATEFISCFQGCQFYLKSDLKNSENPIINSTAKDIAYLLFTSGSTGEPKAVAVSNFNVTSYLDFISENYDLTENDRFSQTFDLTFDLSVHDMFVCWQSGGCLVIPEKDSSFFMSKYIKNNKVSVWFSVPSLAVMMSKMRLLKTDAFPALKYSFFCGEPFFINTALDWQKAASKSKVINLYGPSETTIAISNCELKNENNPQKNGVFSIGKVFPTQEYCIINDKIEVLQSGEKGELCFRGSQVINGYFNDPESTDRSFIQIPGKGNKMWYKTGDLIIEETGNLFYLGRLDSEVKVGGFRVNLQEIDYIIMKSSGSEFVASVSFSKANDGVNKLYSFVCPAKNSTILESGIISSCKEKLPWYMIPEKVFIIEKMPLNKNGKIDKRELIEKYLK